MTQEVIFGIGVLIGLLLFKKTNPILLKIILVGLAVCFFLGLLNVSIIASTIGFIGFGILSFIFAVYCLVKKLWLEAVIGIFATITIIQGIMNWPYYSEMQLSMIIPILCFIIICVNWKRHIHQISISIVLTFYMLTLFLDLIKGWM